MKKILFALPVFAILFFANAQKCQAENNDMFNKEIVADTVYYQMVDESPSYPAGPDAVIQTIKDNLEYSGDYKGRVIMQLKITSDGVVRDVDLLRLTNEPLRQALKKACKKLGKFNPGKQGGAPVNAILMVPFAI